MPLTPRQRRALLTYGDCAQIARDTARSKAHVHYVLYGARRDTVVEKAFARLLRRPVAELFATPPTR